MVGEGTPALAGTISDGSGVGQIVCVMYPAIGSGSATTVTVVGNQWSVVLDEPIGVYDLYVTAADVAGNSRLLGPYEVEVVDVPNCFVESNGDDTSDYFSTDGSALQTALDNATAGDLLKVAGTCGSQTITITQDVTITGGFNPVDWLAPPDPDIYPTVLDAAGQGKVINVPQPIDMTLRNLTIQNGFSDEGAGLEVDGGTANWTAC